MKKIGLLIIVLVVVLTCGCSNEKVQCSLVSISHSTEVVMTFKGRKVSTSTVTNTYKDADMAKDAYSILKTTNKNIVLEDNKVIINDFHNNLDIEDLTRDNIIKYYENQKYVCKK